MQNHMIGSHAVTSDMKRALTGKGFFAGVIGMVLLLFFSSAEKILPLVRSGEALANGQHAKWLMDALTSDWTTLTLPILCALPFTTAFVDDIKSGFIKQYLPRSGTAAYIRGKLVACALSGGLVLPVGILIAYTLFALAFTPMELALGPGKTAPPFFAQVLTKAVLLSFSGAFWSLAGFTFAAATMNQYMAYASPFIFYYILIILKERYFHDLYVLYPKEWLNPSNVWVMGGFGVVLLLTALSCTICLVFVILAKRRISDV